MKTVSRKGAKESLPLLFAPLRLCARLLFFC